MKVYQKTSGGSFVLGRLVVSGDERNTEHMRMQNEVARGLARIVEAAPEPREDHAAVRRKALRSDLVALGVVVRDGE